MTEYKKSSKAGDYKTWKEKHKIEGKGTKKSYDKMREVCDFFERSQSYLESSCFHDAYQEDSEGATISGGSWYDRWDLQEKMALMWYRRSNSDDFTSNIKSPMARGRINTFVNWMKKVNIEFGSKPNNKDDRNAAIMAEKLTNFWMENSNAKSVLGDAWEDLAIHGTTYLRLSYIKETKEYRFPKTTNLTDEEKEEVKEGKKKVLFSDPEEYLLIDDAVLEHVPLREGFPEPSARNLHGDTYKAARFGRKRYVTLDAFKALYGDHPNAINVDKVKGSSAYRNMTEYFFQPPTDFMSDDIVELKELEDQDNDCFYVVANDLPILGCIDEEPLPYGHKEISYHKLDFIRVPGQFFSIGICDLLDNIQASFEVALNMVADYLYRTYNYRLLVEADNYGEIKQALQRTGDMFIPIDASDGKALNSKVMPLPVSQIGFDIFSFLELLEKNATLATNIDPAQMALLAGSKTATSDILNKELLMTMIGGVVENNINGDLRQIGRQLWKLQQQHYTKPRVKKITGEDKKEQQKLVPRTIRFEGIELKLNEETGILEENESEVDYSFFEITDEYLSTKDEVDIFIKPESKEISSQALDEQNMEKEFAQMIPFSVDPNNANQVMNHPMPMVDATELFKEYFYTKRLPQTLLLNKNKDTNRAIKTAEEHILKILGDEYVTAVPGQSSSHLEYQYQVLDSLTFKAEGLNKEIEEELQKQVQQIISAVQDMGVVQDPTGGFMDPNTGQQVEIPQPQPNEEKIKQLEMIEEKIEKLEKHIMIEAMPASMRNSRIATLNSNAGASEAPPMSAPMPPGAEGQISPDMINPMDPAAQVPMGGNMTNGQMGMMPAQV